MDDPPTACVTVGEALHVEPPVGVVAVRERGLVGLGRTPDHKEGSREYKHCLFAHRPSPILEPGKTMLASFALRCGRL